MMKKTLGVIILSMLWLMSCRHQESNNDSLLGGIDFANRKDLSDVKLSDLLTDYSIIELETNDSCLIGDNRGKYVKKEGIIYVKSFNEIMEFDESGKFLRKLSRQGNGPEEYGGILDFEIVPGKDGKEIWIGSESGISRYDARTLAFIGRKDYEGFPSQIRYVNDTTFLVVSAGDKWFNAWSPEGKVRQRYFDEDQANSLRKISQFNNTGDRIFYQIEDTNEAVVYDPATDAFTMSKIFDAIPEVQTISGNREAMAKYGYLDFHKETDGLYDTMIYVRTSGGMSLAQLFRKDGSRTLILSRDGKTRVMDYDMANGGKANDIVPDINIRFLTTPVATDSDSGFLFILEPLDGDGDSNPRLLDVAKIL